jgi:putative transcriptional regulator
MHDTNDPHMHDEMKTDWARVAAMTDEEVTRAALADPDAQPLTPEQLARMRRIPRPKHIRQNLNNLSQRRFARLFQIPEADIQAWEQGEPLLNHCAISLFRVIEREPLAAACALNPHLAEADIARELGLDLVDGTAPGEP